MTCYFSVSFGFAFSVLQLKHEELSKELCVDYAPEKQGRTIR